MRPAPCPLVSLFALVVVTTGIAGCRNVVEQPPDAGLAGVGEGEGEGEEGEGEGEGDGCPDDPVLGLTVTVSDNVTLFRVCTATVTITEGAFSEDLVLNGSGETCDYRGAASRPGTYEVTAAADGYNPFSVSNITVQADACGDPVTRQVSVRLNPL